MNHLFIIPPSITRFTPVTKKPSSPLRKRQVSTISSGLPTLPGGCWLCTISLNLENLTTDLCYGHDIRQQSSKDP